MAQDRGGERTSNRGSSSQSYVPKISVPRNAPRPAYSSPVIATRPAAPAYQAPAYQPTYYQPAYQAPAYQAPAYQAPAEVAKPTPIVEPKPVKPKIDYSKMDSKGISNLDSTFQEQLSLFAQAMKRYEADNKRSHTQIDTDTNLAKAGIGRNRDQGLTSLNEDFASRGLGASGLLLDSRGKASDAYKRQEDAVNTSKSKGVSDLDMKMRNYKAETGSGGTKEQAARREAISRLVTKQNLT